jgi:hypothetical protein
MNSRDRTTTPAPQRTTEKSLNGGVSAQPAKEPATNSTPTVICPGDVSDMSLTEAAYWIATECGLREFDVYDAEIWKSAFDQLLKKIREKAVTVLGRRFGNGLHKDVPESDFLLVRVSYPYCGQPSDLVTDDDPHLQCWGILDEDHRRNGFNDKLFQGRLDIEWSDLRIRSADIALHWPLAAAPKGQPGAKMKYDWPEVRDLVFKIMEKNGEFKDWDVGSGWTCQADLVRLVMDYLNNEPSDSSVKSYVKKFLFDWRNSKLANN